MIGTMRLSPSGNPFKGRNVNESFKTHKTVKNVLKVSYSDRVVKVEFYLFFKVPPLIHNCGVIIHSRTIKTCNNWE